MVNLPTTMLSSPPETSSHTVLSRSQAFAALVDEGQLRGRADHHLAAVGLFHALDHAEQRRLAGAVGADDADDGAGRHLEAQVVHQQPVAEALADAVEVDHLVAQALAHRDEDLVGLVALLVVDVAQLLEARQPRLALALPALGVGAHPLQLLLHRLGARVLGLLLLLQALFLLLQPVGVVALVGDAAAAVELQDPLGRVVQEVAVVGDADHGARVALQEDLQPLHAFGVQVVGGLVQQQHVGLAQQQPAQRDAALLAAGQRADQRVPRRQAQRVGGDLQLQVGVLAAGGGDDRLPARPVRPPACRNRHRARHRRHRPRRAAPWRRARRRCPAPPPGARSGPGRAAAPAAGSRCSAPASARPRLRCPCPARP